VIFSAIYLLVRCLLGCLMVLARVRYQPGDRLWLAALSKLVPRHGGVRSSR
jgi:hypothetical protein